MKSIFSRRNDLLSEWVFKKHKIGAPDLKSGYDLEQSVCEVVLKLFTQGRSIPLDSMVVVSSTMSSSAGG